MALGHLSIAGKTLTGLMTTHLRRTTTDKAFLANITGCGPLNCSFPQGICVNGTCHCEILFAGPSCEAFSTGYLTTFATLCYILFIIASIQLILCMINDSQDGPQLENRCKKAFRITVQKCILGTVIVATGTRAIYFTVQRFGFPEKWADIIHNVYYPAFITAFSVLICFWAEVFYNSSEVFDTQDFLRKHHYFLGCSIFNILLYLLLLSDVIATPLVNEVEQARKSVVIGSIFVTLLLIMLVGFLHYGVRLFFRPDWRPLSDVFKVNVTQQTFSCVGVVSNALMQCLIIALLLVNLTGQYLPVDSHSLYTSSMVIHIIELGLPIWFCCSLWNFKRPTSLWLLNPSLLLQPRAIVNDTNNSESVTSPLLSSELPKDYGTITDERENATKGEVPDCWICLDSGDTSDLFKPCSCPAVHRECLNKWIKERATSTSHKSALQCQVCKKRYGVVKTKFHCITKDLTIKHWLIGVGLFVLFVVVSCLSSLVRLVSSTSGRVAVVCAVIIVDAIILKFIGFCALWAYKRSRVTQLILVGDPIQISMELKHDKNIHPPTQLTIQQTTLSLQ